MNCTADCQTAKLKVGGRGVFWAVSAKRRGLAYIITQICKNISIDKTMGGGIMRLESFAPVEFPQFSAVAAAMPAPQK